MTDLPFAFDLTPLVHHHPPQTPHNRFTDTFDGMPQDTQPEYNNNNIDNNSNTDSSSDRQCGVSNDQDPHGIQAQQASASDRLHTHNAFHPLTHDEYATYTSMLERDDNAEVFVMPNHRVDEVGNLRGFRLVVDRDSDCVQLPITREMFMGTTCVECDPGDRDIHPDVIRLLNNPCDVKAALLGMLQEIAQHKSSEMVTLDHMPIYGDTEIVAVSVDDNCTGRERSEIMLENLIAERIGHHSTTMRGRDSRQWKCDMPTAVGVYHAHVRCRDSGRRHHKMFITVSGGCRRASEQFYNMNLDLLGNARATELESCEEAWWLRRTSTRSRCRTAKMVTDVLQLSVPMGGDVFDFEDAAYLPVFTTDTLDHDISETDDGRVALFNQCCDSTSISNGVLCSQHDTEGTWVFQGSHQSAVGNLTNFGGVFGHQERCGAFPTGTFSLYEHSYQQQMHPTTADDHNRNNTDRSMHHNGPSEARSLNLHSTRLNLYKEKFCNHVVHYNPLSGHEVEIDFDSRPHCVKMDEAFLKHLESHDWMREYQVVQLIPVINLVQTSLILP
jgi:hypothetical protein